MGTSTGRDDILAFFARAKRDRKAMADALATVEQFNARVAAGRTAWFWPTIGAALLTEHHWLIVVCDSCGTVIEADLTMKRRDPDASVQVALSDLKCPRCNGDGRPRITGLLKFPTS
jgi:hypothetical protein